jgi:hypothetical protein
MNLAVLLLTFKKRLVVRENLVFQNLALKMAFQSSMLFQSHQLAFRKTLA